MTDANELCRSRNLDGVVLVAAREGNQGTKGVDCERSFDGWVDCVWVSCELISFDKTA